MRLWVFKSRDWNSISRNSSNISDLQFFLVTAIAVGGGVAAAHAGFPGQDIFDLIPQIDDEAVGIINRLDRLVLGIGMTGVAENTKEGGQAPLVAGSGLAVPENGALGGVEAELADLDLMRGWLLEVNPGAGKGGARLVHGRGVIGWAVGHWSFPCCWPGSRPGFVLLGPGIRQKRMERVGRDK